MKGAPAPLGGDRLGGTANVAEHLRARSGQDRQEGTCPGCRAGEEQEGRGRKIPPASGSVIIPWKGQVADETHRRWKSECLGQPVTSLTTPDSLRLLSQGDPNPSPKAGHADGRRNEAAAIQALPTSKIQRSRVSRRLAMKQLIKK